MYDLTENSDWKYEIFNQFLFQYLPFTHPAAHPTHQMKARGASPGILEGSTYRRSTWAVGRSAPSWHLPGNGSRAFLHRESAGQSLPSKKP